MTAGQRMAVAVQQHTEAVKAWKWRQWAILGLGLAILGILIWQLITLSPRGWCQTAFDFSKTDRVTEVIEALKTCVGLQIKILMIKDHVIIGLIVAVIMTQFLFLSSEFGMRSALKGPGGWGMETGKDGTTQHLTGKIEGEIAPTDPSEEK